MGGLVSHVRMLCEKAWKESARDFFHDCNLIRRREMCNLVGGRQTNNLRYETRRCFRNVFRGTVISGRGWAKLGTLQRSISSALILLTSQGIPELVNLIDKTQHVTYPEVAEAKVKGLFFFHSHPQFIHRTLSSSHSSPHFAALPPSQSPSSNRPPFLSLINTSPLTVKPLLPMRKDTGILLFTSCCMLSEQYAE